MKSIHYNFVFKTYDKEIKEKKLHTEIKRNNLVDCPS